MGKLTEELDAFRTASTDGVDILAMRRRVIDEVIASGLAPGLELGEQIPEFSLPDAHGRSVSSTELLALGPLVISFYRGAWCPYCNMELRALQASSAEIEALGGSIVAISPQRPDDALGLTEKHTLSFPVLSDLDGSVSRAFRIHYEIPGELREWAEGRGSDFSKQNADGSWTLPISATYVTDSAGVVILGKAEADWRVRLDPDEIIDVLTKIDQ